MANIIFSFLCRARYRIDPLSVIFMGFSTKSDSFGSYLVRIYIFLGFGITDKGPLKLFLLLSG